MVRGARWVYAGLAWAFVLGLVVQVFFIGLALFAGRENLELHVNLGWVLHLAPILLLVVGAVGRVGRDRLLWALALAVTVFIVPVVIFARDTLPAAAALHPVLALIAFSLGIHVAREAGEALRQPDLSAPPASAGADG